MSEQLRDELTPQEYIRHMFAETVNGKLTIDDYPNPCNEYLKECMTFEVNWTVEDADELVKTFDMLSSALMSFGQLHDQLDEEDLKNLFLGLDPVVWDIYVRYYGPMKENWAMYYPFRPCVPPDLRLMIDDVAEHSGNGELFEGEEARQKRLPFKRNSCYNLIVQARLYEWWLCMRWPELLARPHGQHLAEQMVLYYFGKEDPTVWD